MIDPIIHDQIFMLRALEVSKRALPNCQPNPPVGCVLVVNNKIVSEGYTHKPGEYHAEAHAISNYAGNFSDVTTYVTLEPCSFTGRTPSCARTLVKLAVSRVVVAVIDSDPRNSGEGIRILRDAGIAVDTGVCTDEVNQFIDRYLL